MTNRSCAILFAILSLLAPPLTAAEPTPRQLADQFDSAYQSADWARAIDLAEQLATTDAGAVIGAYNAACAHARAGHAEESADWLLIAAQRGFTGIRSLEEDADLEPIRGTEKFARALALVQANADKRFEEYKAVATETEVLTITPDAFDPGVPSPFLVVLHGSGGTPEPLAELYKNIANELGMVLVVPAALRPWGDGFGWTYRDESEWMVLHLIDRLAESHHIDRGRVYLAGFSQGANVTLSVGLKHPDKFAGLFPVSGHYEADAMPITDCANPPPVYLMVGARDPFVQTFRDAVEPLEKAGFPVRLRILQGIAHEYPKRPDPELRKGFRFLIEERNESP
ncbi:MAG: hypothetical protein KC996_06585 [Phycisphaerales bacterium]|nr:hypothetical protein [Phycisphaerales bacterium]